MSRYPECEIDKLVEALAKELDQALAVDDSDHQVCAYAIQKLESMLPDMREKQKLYHLAVEATKYTANMKDEHDRLHAQEHHLKAEILQAEARLLQRFIEYIRKTLKEKEEV